MPSTTCLPTANPVYGSIVRLSIKRHAPAPSHQYFFFFGTSENENYPYVRRATKRPRPLEERLCAPRPSDRRRRVCRGRVWYIPKKYRIITIILHVAFRAIIQFVTHHIFKIYFYCFVSYHARASSTRKRHVKIFSTYIHSTNVHARTRVYIIRRDNNIVFADPII